MSFLPAICMMCLIFYFSSQSGMQSGRLSYRVGLSAVHFANESLDLDMSEEEMEAYTVHSQYYIRKAAHITEYFLLAVSVAFPFYVYGVRGIWLLLLGGVICVGYAGLDEYHQSFVAARGPSPKDVAIDSIGIFAGLILSEIVCFLGRVTIFRPLATDRPKRRRRRAPARYQEYYR